MQRANRSRLEASESAPPPLRKASTLGRQRERLAESPSLASFAGVRAGERRPRAAPVPHHKHLKETPAVGVAECICSPSSARSTSASRLLVTRPCMEIKSATFERRCAPARCSDHCPPCSGQPATRSPFTPPQTKGTHSTQCHCLGGEQWCPARAVGPRADDGLARHCTAVPFRFWLWWVLSPVAARGSPA